MVPPECWVLMRYEISIKAALCLVPPCWSQLRHTAPGWNLNFGCFNVLQVSATYETLWTWSPLITVAPQLGWTVLPHFQLWQVSISICSQSDPSALLFTAKGRNVSNKASTWIWWSSSQSKNAKEVACHILSTALQLLGALQAIFHLAEHSPSCKRIWTKSAGMTCIITV